MFSSKKMRRRAAAVAVFSLLSISGSPREAHANAMDAYCYLSGIGVWVWPFGTAFFAPGVVSCTIWYAGR